VRTGIVLFMLGLVGVCLLPSGTWQVAAGLVLALGGGMVMAVLARYIRFGRMS
jgi:hypothetical protein